MGYISNCLIIFVGVLPLVYSIRMGFGCAQTIKNAECVTYIVSIGKVLVRIGEMCGDRAYHYKN